MLFHPESVDAGVSEHFDILLALCSDRDILHRAADAFLKEFNVFLCIYGKLLKPTAAGNIGFPAVHVFIDRLCLDKLLAHREVGGSLAVHFVSDADRDPVKVGENIQLRHRDAGRALNKRAVL